MSAKAEMRIKPVLEGAKVRLRPFADADWESMIDILEDRDVKVLTGSAKNDREADQRMDDAEREQIRNWYQSRNQQTDRLDLAIIDRSTGVLVGEVVFNDYEPDTNITNFRILIGPAGRNKGLGTEATALFLQYGFGMLAFHKVELEVYSFNPRAERAYQKNGFVLEGVRRQSFKFNDEYIDTKLYGLLRSEYLEKTERRGI